MTPKHIASRDNPAYREWLKLATDKRARREQARTLLEGPHLVQSALDADASLLAWLLTEQAHEEGRFNDLTARCPDLPMLLVPDGLFKHLAPSDTPAGLLAMLSMPVPGSAQASFAVLLEDIRDPGNLGALIRCAAGAGVAAVYLSPGCAEAWSPKCLRGGQGAHFAVHIHEGADLPAIAAAWPTPCRAAVLGAAESLFELDLRGPCAFAFGNEGAGLSRALQEACAPFSIPMPGRVESLNVATAAAVCLFERVRQAGASQ